MIELQTLGPVKVLLDGAEPPPELLWRKNLALLLYLARSRGRRRSREHLIGLFWGDKPDRKARHSLNEALSVLRRTGGDDCLGSVGDQILLNESSVAIDVEALERQIETQDWTSAVDLVRGTWMEGFTVPGSSDFEDWLSGERHHWNGMSTSALQAQGAEQLARGADASARELARLALAIDPFSDAAIRLLMESAALQGEKALALGLYGEFVRRLDVELGIEPEPDTAALAERVHRERSWRLPPSLPEAEVWSRRPPLVGRERELEAMVAAVRRSMTERQPALIICQGESGSGKSRLAEELVARARLEGATVARMRAVPTDATSDWSALLGLARGGLLEGDGEAEATAEALGPMPRAFTELSVAAAGIQPLVLWIDNAEHLDPSSVRALPGLLRDLDGKPCTLLLTMQNYPANPQIDELRTRVGRELMGKVLTLRPLDAVAIDMLAASMIPGLSTEDRRRLARRILVDSAGLPLFAVDLLNGVRLGLEIEEEQTWPQPFRTMDQTFPGDLPDTVTAAIRIGFRRLSEAAQQVLSAAAVLDEPVTHTTIGRSSTLDPAVVADALDELEWHRWLSGDARGYSFTARIVRDVIARDMLTSGQRLRIKEAAGD